MTANASVLRLQFFALPMLGCKRSPGDIPTERVAAASRRTRRILEESVAS